LFLIGIKALRGFSVGYPTGEKFTYDITGNERKDKYKSVEYIVQLPYIYGTRPPRSGFHSDVKKLIKEKGIMR
jgi:hypothetical protein